MLISIITPNFNSSSFINTTKQSILDQTHQNWEWLIIDDGSTDDSLEIIKEFSKHDSRIKLLDKGNGPKGASTCRNVGIDNASGDYLFLLDADDILARCCLENRLKSINENPGLDFGVFNMGMFQHEVGDVEGVVNLYSEKADGYLELFLSYKLPWAITCPLWKTSFLKRNGIRFSEKYSRLQDPEFHAKLLLEFQPLFKVFKDSEPDCFYRLPDNTKKGAGKSSNKALSSAVLFYDDLTALIEKKQLNNKYNAYLDQFVLNIFHSQLFYTRLDSIKPITEFYNKLNEIRSITNLSRPKVILFALFNYAGLTFVKGAGVSRLWNKWS